MNQTNRPGGYVVAVGPNDIDEYYECVQPLVVGDKCFIRQLSVSPGGLTANSAVILSAFGTKTYLLDSLGDDQYTPMLLEDLRSHGTSAPRSSSRATKRRCSSTKTTSPSSP